MKYSKLSAVGIFLWTYAIAAQAFTCYITVAKDSCWTNYAVTIKVTDVSTGQELLSLHIPKGKSWIRQKFTCTPKQTFMYTASFAPIIWESDANKVYSAKRYWSLPLKITPPEEAWEIKTCYARDFAINTAPATADGNCKCDFSAIPKIGQ